MTTDLRALKSDVLQKLKFDNFNSMQQAVIDDGVAGKSLMVLSPTGSGKTVAFLAVLLARLDSAKVGVTALVLTPTRELALQVESVFRLFNTPFKATCCYGGHSFKTEQQSLSVTPAVVIGTPGRLADHLLRESLVLSDVDIVVLDEFDKLLQMGFEDEMRKIISEIGQQTQVILNSATDIEKLPDFINSQSLKHLDFRQELNKGPELRIVRTKSDVKTETLMNLVSQFNCEPTLVFCNHREAVERISKLLSKHKFEHGTFHGAMEQVDREKSLIKFRSGAQNVLVATDLAARGLDIPVIKHIVHFQIPEHHNEFLHRNGRTARMEADGNAYILLADDEKLPDYLGQEIPELDVALEVRPAPKPKYSCVYVSAGKKDKISRGDILGFLTQSGGLAGEDIGLISVLDRSSYVAISSPKVRAFLDRLTEPRIKKQRVKIALAN